MVKNLLKKLAFVFTFLSVSLVVVILSNCSVFMESTPLETAHGEKTKAISDSKSFGIKSVSTNLQTDTGMYYPVNMEQQNSRYLDFLQRNPNYDNRRHLANDYSVPEGTNVISIVDGVVVFANMNVSNFGGDTPAKNGGAIIIKHKKADGSSFYGLYGHVKNLTVKEGDHVVSGQKIGEVGPYYSKGAYLPHLHFGINTISASTYGYESTSGSTYGFVNPEDYMKANYPEKHEFQGSGSLVSTARNCYGCNKDTVPVYANGNKSFTSFQWMYDAGNCDHVDISANSGKNYSVGIISGHWDTRNNDVYYTAKLPISIGHPRASYNLVGIMLPSSVSEDDYLIAKCSTSGAVGVKTEISRNIKGIPLNTGSIWSGQGSIISDNTFNDTGYGKTKDVALLKNSTETSFGTSTFQWQPSSRCTSLNLRDASNMSQKANLSIRQWNQGNNVTVLYDVQLPYKITSSTKSDLKSGQYYVVTARSNSFASGQIVAECSN